MISGRVCLGSEADLYTRLSGCPLMPQKQTELLCEPYELLLAQSGGLSRIMTLPPNAGAAPRRYAGAPQAFSASAAMVCASSAAPEALPSTRMSRPCLRSARLSLQLARPGALLAFAHSLGCQVTKPGLFGSPLHFAQTNPVLMFADLLVDVAFEPGFFGRHLRPHDALARACAYCVANPFSNH